MEPGTLAGLVQAGGVTALAVLVYLELRQIRPILRSLDRSTTALLERERDRTGPIQVQPTDRIPRLRDE